MAGLVPAIHDFAIAEEDVDARHEAGMTSVAMRTDLFDFDLPPERIALRPIAPRDAARLLVVRPGGAPELEDRGIRDLPDLLQPGDALVVNDTKVIPARLKGRRLGRGDTQPSIEATLHRRLDGSRWRAFVRPAKKLEKGDVLRFGEEGKVCFLGELDATVEEKGEGGEVTLAFAFDGAVLDQAIEERGDMPLPPYIASRRDVDAQDRADYQTLFARQDGSVAAPTASLHFTEALLARLRERGVAVHIVTLHVGAGTFLPVRADDTEQHKMHPEWGTVTAETAEALNAVRRAGGRIVAAGSTSLRLLESAAGEDGLLRPFSGETALFITPGYRIKAVDVMLTNFHLPRSTLFMLVSAFAGLDAMRRAYAHAIAAGYRFYSYGDACLLFRSKI
jgi:S-adenosylmethionine:tRNA ribosyltransferase-isomerase